MNNDTPNNQNLPEPSFQPWQRTKGTSIVYYLILGQCIIAVSVLPLIVLDLYLTVPGMIRPINERAEVRSSTASVVTRLFYQDGDSIAKDSTLLILQDPALDDRLALLQTEIQQKTTAVEDLKRLIASAHRGAEEILPKVLTPEYKKQFSRFIYQRIGKETALKKLNHELQLNTRLFHDKVVAGNDLFNKQLESEEATAAFQSFIGSQVEAWHQMLSETIMQVRRLQTEKRQLLQEKSIYRVKAPVSGVIQMSQPIYEGSVIQPGEPICSISPETTLIAECYVESKDIAFLNACKTVSIQVDAFPYSYFGLITGNILSIDNDFSVVSNRPVFKVFCALDKNQLSLKNGYTGKLKKGMTLQARFLITKRTAWQLVSDKLNDWLNPTIKRQG